MACSWRRAPRFRFASRARKSSTTWRKVPARAGRAWISASRSAISVAMAGHPITEGPTMYVAHLLTPETERTTHYLWAAARNSLRDDTQISEKIRAGIDDAFRNEDGPMIADCQQRMGTTDLMSLKPLLLKSDAAAVNARRVLAQLIDQETREASVPQS
ncbi:MAG: hypothetical protein ACREFT_07745 [Acetobacteraceae bacterium]